MPIKVTIPNTKEMLRELANIEPTVERVAIAGMSQIAYDAMLSGAERHHKKGALVQSTYNKPITGGREVGHDPQRAPHALFVVFGTRPHKIVPNKKKMLRWAGGGGFHFARFVNHPGYIGDPYVVRAADDAVRAFASIVDQAIRKA